MSAPERLLEAVKAGDSHAVESLLVSNPELAHARDPAGVSAILWAVYRGHIDVAELLLKKAQRLDIFEAAAVGNANRIRELLEADPNLRNTYSADGWTPLHLAAFFGREAAALVLVEKGADPNLLSKNATANTPLHAAVANRRINLVRLVLAGGADVNARTGNQWTPLHHAAFVGSRDIAQVLLEQRPDLAARNDKNQTGLDIAAEEGHKEIVELLQPRKTAKEST